MALRPAPSAAITTYAFPGVMSQHVPGVNGEKGEWVQARAPLGTLAAFTLWVGAYLHSSTSRLNLSNFYRIY